MSKTLQQLFMKIYTKVNLKAYATEIGLVLESISYMVRILMNGPSLK